MDVVDMWYQLDRFVLALMMVVLLIRLWIIRITCYDDGCCFAWEILWSGCLFKLILSSLLWSNVIYIVEFNEQRLLPWLAVDNCDLIFNCINIANCMRIMSLKLVSCGCGFVGKLVFFVFCNWQYLLYFCLLADICPSY